MRRRRRYPALALGLSALASYGVLATAPAHAAELVCFGKIVTIEGTAGGETLQGSSGADVIYGGGGADIINGNGGEDVICAGAGNDTITGGDQRDILSGGAGTDTIDGKKGPGDFLGGGDGIDTMTSASPGAQVLGGPARDNITGEAADQTLWGFDGNDRITSNGPAGDVDGGPGDDRIWVGDEGVTYVRGMAGDDIINTGKGVDGSKESPVDGGPGTDTINTGMETDHVQGGPGRDTIDLGDGVDGYAYGDGGRDTITSNQAGSTLDGGAEKDTLTATAPDILLAGHDGDDVITGSRWPDTIIGGEGDDEIRAGAGDDVEVWGNAGEDTMYGGDGVDVLHGDEDGDLMSGGASSTGDVLHGDDGADVIWVSSVNGRGEGGAGNDKLYAVGPGAVLVGDAGEDLLTGQFLKEEHPFVAHGGPDGDELIGKSKDDELHGDGGDDVLQGGGGDDHLYGETDIDVCAGGAGSDWCDGGPLGTDVPSPDDPDTCKADVESKHNCRDASGFWSGTAEGTLQHGNGVVEEWGASYSMDPVVKGYNYSGKASIQWRISGTDGQGCTYDGAGVVPGRAGLTTWTDNRVYYVDVYPALGSNLPVTVDCPNQEPKTEDWIVMNTNAAEGEKPLPKEQPYLKLVGAAGYQPMNGGPDSWASWSWSIVRN